MSKPIKFPSKVQILSRLNLQLLYQFMATNSNKIQATWADGTWRQRVRNLVRAPKGEASVRRDVLRLALPATGEQMLSMMVGIVDTFLVGHLGAASLAAVGLASQWIFLAYTLLGATATGSTALIARFIGAKESEQANRVVRQSVWLGALIGLGCSLVGAGLAWPAVLLLGAEAEVVTLSTSYLRIVAGFLFFSSLMFIGNACLRGAGDTRTPLYVMLVVNLVNISVAWTTINGLWGLPKLGVVGSALGAASGQLVGGILVLANLLKGRSGIRLNFAHFRPEWGLVRRILRIGLPTGVEQVFFRTGNMAYVRILAALGIAAYAANQVAINSWSLSFMPGFGFAVAATTLVGQSLGAQDPEEAQRRGFATYWMGAGLMGFIGLSFVFFPTQIMGFFTNDQEVIGLGALPLRIMGIFQPILAASMIFTGGLRGAGDTRYPMVVTAGGIWLVRLPLAYLFAIGLGWGLTGAWSSMAIDLTIRALLNFLRFRSGRWKAITV
ncbi:MAG: MATE family efflux transporter [Anaerolineae bacterium]